MHERGREADRKKKSGWDRKKKRERERKLPVLLFYHQSKNTCWTVLLIRQRLCHPLQKRKKILQISRHRQVWVYHTPTFLPPDSKYSPVSSVPPLCISQSFPDRNPLLQWGYILPQWIQAPVDTLGSPAPDLTPPPQPDYPPAPPDWDTHQTDMQRWFVATQVTWAGMSPQQKKAMVGWMWGRCWHRLEAGSPALPYTLAERGRRGSATAQTYKPSAGCARSAASPSHTPEFIRHSIIRSAWQKYCTLLSEHFIRYTKIVFIMKITASGQIQPMLVWVQINICTVWM